MSTQRAIVTQGPGEGAQVVSDAPRPKLRDTNIIVNTKAVALNPTDWMHIDFLSDKGCISGCDYAGIVEEVGTAVTNGLKVGDRVAGFAHGGNVLNHEDGAFAEHVSAKAHVAMKIPDSVSYEEAATLGVGITTVGQALYQSLGLPYPTEPAKEKTHLLIYGASTATGTLAVQFAKLSGLEVTALASPHNFELLKSLGADHVFDYRSPTCTDNVRAATNNDLHYALDCVPSVETAKLCVDAMGPGDGKYSSLITVAELPRKDIANLDTAAYTALGEDCTFGATKLPASKEDEKFAADFWALAADLLAKKKFKVHPPLVKDGGFEGVLQGLQDLREKKVSGGKLVYTV